MGCHIPKLRFYGTHGSGNYPIAFDPSHITKSGKKTAQINNKIGKYFILFFSPFVLSFQDFLKRFELIKYKVKPEIIVNKPKIENARKSQFPILSLD